VYIRLGSDCDLAFSINAGRIDFVENYKHLGHVINSAFDDREDIADKRGVFVEQGNNVICYFNKLGSHVIQQLYSMHIVLVLSAASFGDSITPKLTRFSTLCVAQSDMYGFLSYEALLFFYL
jgi:hypothetical protein